MRFWLPADSNGRWRSSGPVASNSPEPPLPSSARVPPDPIDTTGGFLLKADLSSPLLNGFLGYDDVGALVLRGRRDGTGLSAVLMNFVIEGALGQPYFRIRQPTTGGIHLNAPFKLLAADGTAVGDLHFSMNRASLEIPGRLPMTASTSMVSWHGYSVVQGDVELASVSFTGHPLSIDGADLRLTLSPLATAQPRRRWVIALVAWATLFSPPWGRMTTR